MSVTNARDWQPAEQSHSDRVPLWVTGVTVALLALGFTRSRASPAAGSNPNRQGEVHVLAFRRGRGRAATHPLEVPARVGRTSSFASGRTSARIASSSLLPA